MDFSSHLILRKIIAVSWVALVLALPADIGIKRSFPLVQGPTNGQVCGPTHGGQRCDPGWCCGPEGICGQGSYYCSGPDCLFEFSDACDANSRPRLWIDTSDTPRPLFGSVPYGVNLASCFAPGMVAMTFDDGPSAYTPKLLDMLAAADMKATFFLTGNNGGKGSIGDPAGPHYEIVKRMIEDGHQVAQHTWTHQDLEIVSPERRRQQILYNEAALASAIGVIPTYIRPPYLSCTEECIFDLKSLGYHVIWQDLDTFDWKKDYQAAINTVYNAIALNPPTTHSFISLAHDIHEESVNSLASYLIDIVKKQGYRTVTVGECMLDPPENWYRNLHNGEPQIPRGAPYTIPWSSNITLLSEPFVPVSSGGLCGRSVGQTCVGSNFSNCCSESGYCGSSDEYCSNRCQQEFGTYSSLRQPDVPIPSLPLSFPEQDLSPSPDPSLFGLEDSDNLLVVPEAESPYAEPHEYVNERVTTSNQPWALPPSPSTPLLPNTTEDGTCGAAYGLTCRSSAFGQCCSQWG